MNEQQEFDLVELRKAKQAAFHDLLRPNGNILGVGIGKKIVNNTTTQQDCIRVYVVAKFKKKDLSEAAIVPDQYRGVPTDVIEVARFGREGGASGPKAGTGPQPGSPVRVQPGSPIRVETTAPNVNSGFRGTLGAVVTDGKARYILSCNHVLSVNGRVFNDPKAVVVSAEFVGDESEIADPVDRNGFVQLKPGDAGNPVDCAVARLRGDSVNSPHDSSKNTIDVDTLDLGTAVRKNGAATGPTGGKIVDKEVDLYIDYSFGTFLFKNQILVAGESDDAKDAFAMAGDSGSLVMTGDGNGAGAVGLIFAASGRYAVACRLTEVFKQLESAAEPKLSPGSLRLVY